MSSPKAWPISRPSVRHADVLIIDSDGIEPATQVQRKGSHPMKRGMHVLRNQRRPSRCRVSIAILLLALPTQSHAANKFWNNTSGGTFSTSSNWQSCGFFCTRVPGTSDVANFGISDPSSLFQFVYTVSFSAAASNQALVVQDDLVTFDLNGHTYTT